MAVNEGANLPITFIKISGPGVDALENRKECGTTRDITEAEMRASFERVKDANFAALKMLCRAALRNSTVSIRYPGGDNGAQ
jgi:hypothetical protein